MNFLFDNNGVVPPNLVACKFLMKSTAARMTNLWSCELPIEVCLVKKKELPITLDSSAASFTFILQNHLLLIKSYCHHHQCNWDYNPLPFFFGFRQGSLILSQTCNIVLLKRFLSMLIQYSGVKESYLEVHKLAQKGT